MRNYKGTILLVAITLAVLLVTVNALTKAPPHPLQGVNKQVEKQDKYARWLELRSRYPEVDFDALEPVDPEKRLKRAKKNNRYDRSGFAIKDMTPRVSEEVLESDWSLHVAALPASGSATIVTGEVLTSNAHLSNDKSGIYTELTVRIDGVLKGGDADLAPGGVISVDRAGGFVRYPNGHKRLHRIKGQNVPRVGARYVLFLTASEQSDNLHILTGYELDAGKVSPLDESTRMKVYEGMDEAEFLKAVREAVAQPAEVKP